MLRILFAALFFCLTSVPARAVDEETPNDPTANLSPLGRAPDWNELEKFQGTITHDEFAHLLNDVYCSHGISEELIKILPDEARILKRKGLRDFFILHFAADEAHRLPTPRDWVEPDKLAPAPNESKPLAGFHIALDPGHLGGEWAKMEERWFQIGKEPSVQEGDLTLRVAKILAPRLQSLGAKVSLVRRNSEPLTPYRPSDFREIAQDALGRAGVKEPRENFSGPADPEKEKSIRWQEELLFYRNSEIRRRASEVNYRLQPDLVLCLHFNAEPWGDPRKPALTDKNHLHLLVNGSYLAPELDLDDVRFEMLQKLLSRAFPEELGLADELGLTMAKTTGLPAFRYKTDNATAIGASNFVYARNLMATRLYHCPTVYLEPYVMNSHIVFARVEAGDFNGERKIRGKKMRSIFREYADGVVNGLVNYFQRVRPSAKAHQDAE